MKLTLLFAPVILAVLTFASCSDEKKTDSGTVATDSNTVTTQPGMPVSTIITTPQNMVVVRHRVANFAKWKAGYDAHDSMRLANGLHNYVVARGVVDTNIVMLAIKADDMEKAKAFTKSPELKAAMQRSGVAGPPTTSYNILTYQDTSAQTALMRSMTMFTVKDWAIWEKSFLDGTQERIDNGLTVRAYGHDADNKNKVTLVTAIIDSAKAAAYWKSDMLQARRAAGGVIGEPERFMYRVVQRY